MQVNNIQIPKNSENAKKSTTPTYMIHSCTERMWYVVHFLLPSMSKQGIHHDNIIVWEDKSHVGNLESFICSAEWVAETQPVQGGIWHLQDDVIISSDFKKKTENHDHGIVCGFCNDEFDGLNVENHGNVPFVSSWFSFQCIRIPNKYLIGFADWYRGTVVPNHSFRRLRQNGKNDDSMFRMYMFTHYPYVQCVNLETNLVNHIDYMIGGSMVTPQRDIPRMAYRWAEPELLDDIARKLQDSGMVYW